MISIVSVKEGCKATVKYLLIKYGNTVNEEIRMEGICAFITWIRLRQYNFGDAVSLLI